VGRHVCVQRLQDDASNRWAVRLCTTVVNRENKRKIGIDSGAHESSKGKAERITLIFAEQLTYLAWRIGTYGDRWSHAQVAMVGRCISSHHIVIKSALDLPPLSHGWIRSPGS